MKGQVTERTLCLVVHPCLYGGGPVSICWFTRLELYRTLFQKAVSMTQREALGPLPTGWLSAGFRLQNWCFLACQCVALAKLGGLGPGSLCPAAHGAAREPLLQHSLRTQGAPPGLPRMGVLSRGAASSGLSTLFCLQCPCS